MKPFLCGVLVPFLLSGSFCRAAPPRTPRAFLQALHAHYAPGRSGFSPTGAADALFTPSLLALIHQDQAVPAGAVGRLDSDPVCACQDYDGFMPQTIKVTAQTADTARATVRFNNDGTETVVGYDLVGRAGQWRIDDIADPQMPSLRAFLTVKR